MPGARRPASRRPILATAALALALLLGSPRDAHAGDDDLVAARAAFNEASALAKQRQWSAACERYERSFALHRSALTLYSLGVAQREAGRLVAARTTFRAFLAEPTTSTTEPYQKPALLAASELSTHIGSLTLVLTPAPVLGATVTLDGVALPSERLTQPHPIDPGPHQILARAPGRANASAPITIAAGRSATLTLTLTQLVPGSAEDRLSRATEGSITWPRALPAWLLGAGGATLVGGVALGLAGVFEAQSATSAMGPDADRARAMGIAGDVLVGTGIAAAAAGLVLLLLQRQSPVAVTGTPPSTSAGAPGPWLRF